MAGIVFSETIDTFDAGIHTNNALAFNEIISSNFIYQTLPVSNEYAEKNGNRIHSYYGGVIFHGEVGTAVTITVVAIILTLGILYASGAGYSE